MLWRTGAVSGIASLLLGTLNLVQPPEDTVLTARFDDESLLAPWHSEDAGDDDVGPECLFYNGSVAYESALCSHFVVARSAATPAQAFVRAKRCAAHFDSACVLSAEIGLAIPAAFLVHGAEATMVLAPKIVRAEDERRVRVHSPTSVLTSRTYRFNRSLSAEHVDGASRTVKTTTFVGDDAYCVQLLRRSFAQSCWDALD
jgi:hypothetical protein